MKLAFTVRTDIQRWLTTSSYSMCLVTREWKVNLLHFISHPTLLEKNHNNRIIFWTKINVTVLGLKKINQQLSKVYSSLSLQVKPVWCYYLSATSSNIWFRNVLHCWFWVHGLLLGWDIRQHNGTRRLIRLNIPGWLLVLDYSFVYTKGQFSIQTIMSWCWAYS